MNTIVVTGIISLFTSIIVSFITSKLSYKSEIQKSVYQERENIYISFEKILADIGRNPNIIFSCEFYSSYRLMTSKMNLYGSDKVIKILSPLNQEITSIHSNYIDLFCSENAIEDRENRMMVGEITEYEVQKEEELFMERNALPENKIIEVYNKYICQVRKELKSDTR